jgi:hypothetical protein
VRGYAGDVDLEVVGGRRGATGLAARQLVRDGPPKCAGRGIPHARLVGIDGLRDAENSRSL